MPQVNQIIKCEGHNCPLKEHCLRFASKGDMYGHSYFVDIPYNQETKSCDQILDTSMQIEMKDITV